MNMKNMKVLFGGSFNPPTVAHYEIAKAIINEFDTIDFVFLPTGNSYYKSNLINAVDRINMLNILCSKLKRARVSDFEVRQKQYKGTFYTLNHFKDYYFVLGADNLVQICTWLNFPDVIKENKFLVLKRDSIDINNFLNSEKLKQYKDNFLIFDSFQETNISATIYRESKDESIVLNEVNEYIITHNLYNKT